MADLIRWAKDRLKDTVNVASRVYDQVNPLDNGLTYQQRTPTSNRSVAQQATHNGVTNVAGDIVKPVVRFPVNFSNTFANLGRQAAGAPRQTVEQQFDDPITRNIARVSGANGSGRQLAGDAINIGLSAFAPGSSKLLEQGVTKLAPQIPKLVPRIVGAAGVGAPTGAVSGVANTLSDGTPLNRENITKSALQGAVVGAGGGAAIPIVAAGARAALPVVKQGAQNAGKVIQRADQRAFTPRVNVDNQNVLRDMSDYLVGANKAGGKELSNTISRARQIAQDQGVDITSGSRAQQLESVNSILDKIGQNNRAVSQGGYARIPRLADEAEQNVFQQNPMLPQNQRVLTNVDAGAKPPELPTFNTKREGNISKAFRSTRSIIERQGKSGKELGNLLQQGRDTQELFLADVQKQLPTVRKLKGKDFENFVEATQGIAKPNSPKIAQAVKEWQITHPGIRERAVNAGLDVGDLGQNYYPHFIDYDRVFKDKNTYNEAINHLVKTGQASTPEEAIKLLGYARDVSRNRQFGNLEASRLVDLPFYDKTPNSLISYLSGSGKRIAQTETFGAKDENALELIKRIGLEGGDTEAAKNAYDIAVGAKQYNPTTSKISQNIRKYVTTTRLGLGALTNVSQNVNTGVVTGHLRTLASAFKQLDPKTRAFVGDTGVIADAVLNDIRTQSGYSSFGQRAAGKVVDKITAPFFGTVEKLNRSISATAGRDYGLRLAQRGDEKTLRRLGVTGDIKNGALTPRQQIQVARKVVEKTQFKVDPQDLPGWTDTPGGKLVAQFRTFSYSQGKFVSNEILKPAIKGNYAPLARLLAALPLGYALYETKRVIAGRPKEDNESKVGLAALQNVGGLGIAFDIYQSLNPVGSQYIPSDRRTSMAVGAAGGPAIGVATQGVGAISEAIQRKNTPEDESRLEGKVIAAKNEKDYTDLTPISRFGLQQIPIVGTPIKNRLLPFKKESESDTGKSETPPEKAVAKLSEEKKQRSKYLKASLSKEDYAISQLSKKDQQKLVDDGTISREKLDGLTNYVKGKKKELGFENTSKFDPYKSPDAEYKEAKRKYEEDKKDGKITAIQDIPRTKQLKKLEIGSTFDKNVRDLYGLGKQQIYDFVTTNENGKDLAEKLFEYDKKLYDAGLSTSLKFKTGIAPSKGRSGNRTGRGRTKKQKAVNVAAITKAIKLPSAGKTRQSKITARKPKLPNFRTTKVKNPKMSSFTKLTTRKNTA